MKQSVRLGVDLGGTKIAAIALAADGTALEERRVTTPAGDYAATVRAVAELVTAVEHAVGQAGTVGVGTPGTLSPATGLIKNSNSECLNGRPLDRDLGVALRRQVRLANDANCFALSEAMDGAAAGALVVFGVILGTGTGGGIIVNGQPLTGPNAIAGEWGHNPLPWLRPEELPTPACYCGLRGCIETFLSGPGMAQDHASHRGEALTAQTIAERALAGDGACDDTLRRYENRLARALATVINVLDPEVIVLGGGVSNIQRLYQTVPCQWQDYVFSDRVDTCLVPARYGDASGVRGAAWLWPSG